VENHHRNNKKHERNGHRRSETRGSVSASPAPQSKKTHRQYERNSHERERERPHNHIHSDHHGTNARRHSTEDNASYKPDLKRKQSAADEERHHERHTKPRKSENGHGKSTQQHDSMMKVIFKPIKDSLKRVQSATKINIKSAKERASVMKKELVVIGDFIQSVSDEDLGEDLRPSFW
jgi:chromodomain-helicase-DNA-binding protein 1